MKYKKVMLISSVILAMNSSVFAATPAEDSSNQVAKEASESKQLSIEERISLLEKELYELKQENESLKGRVDTKEKKDKEKEDRFKLGIFGRVEVSGDKVTGSDSKQDSEWKDDKSYIQLVLSGTGKIDNTWSVKWNQKAKMLFNNTVGTGPSGKTGATSWVSNLTLNGKNVGFLGCSDVQIGKFRTQEISSYSVGKLDMTGIRLDKDFGKSDHVAFTYGRLPQGSPNYANLKVTNSNDHAFFTSLYASHNFGPTKLEAAYRHVDAMNSYANAEFGLTFPIVDNLKGNVTYTRVLTSDGIERNNAYTYNLSYGNYNRRKPVRHDDVIKLSYIHLPSDTVIYGDHRGYRDGNTWKISYYRWLTDNISFDTHYATTKYFDLDKRDQNIGLEFEFFM